MSMIKLVAALGVCVALAAGIYFFVNGSGDVAEMPTSDSPAAGTAENEIPSKSNEKTPSATSDAGVVHRGSYESYAPEKLSNAREGDVVLFFRASWCPTCKVLDTDLRAQSLSIPAGLTILDVNYDTETALKQKYGVTYQHTFVQVDAEGRMITKWSGGQNLASIVANVR